MRLSPLLSALLAVLPSVVVISAVPAASGAESRLQAPFACEQEWVASTHGGHETNDLDFSMLGTIYDEDAGQAVIASAAGDVLELAQTGYNGGRGTYLWVDYGDVTALYMHLQANSIPGTVVDSGTVSRGELIGRVGTTGSVTSAHLHVEHWDSQNAVGFGLSQIPIEFDGVPVSVGDTVMSTNCSGPRIPEPIDFPTGSVPDADVAEPAEEPPFEDIPENSYAYDDIALIATLGITTGTTPTTYDPDLPVTREQMAAFLARLYRLLVPPPSP